MKKLFVLSFICATVVIACTNKAMPSTETTPVKTTETAKNKDQKDMDQKMLDEKVIAEKQAEQQRQDAAKQADAVMTPMDHGKNIFITKCTKCHAAKNAGDYTSSQWDNILKTMSSRAKLSGDEEKQLSAYIKANAKQ